MFNSAFDAIVPMSCVALAALACMGAEAFRSRGERMPIGGLGIVDVGALGRSPHRLGYPMTPAERSRAIVLAL